MESLLKWTTEDWTHRAAYEAMLEDHGGKEYKNTHQEAMSAGKSLEGALLAGQRELYHAYADAVADAAAAREVVATRMALVHGIAIGATLTRFAKVDAPERLMTMASAVTTELLASGLYPSVAASVLDTIHEALDAAELGARQRERAASPEDEPNGAV